jgi:uncharacterized protein with FMN-binding domain
MKNRNRQSNFVRTIKKFFLSAFVIVTFTAYALENRTTVAGHVSQVADRVISTPTLAPVAAAGPPTSTNTSSAAAAPTAAVPAPTAEAATPTAEAAAPTVAAPPTSTATSTPSNAYKNGTFAGSVVDVNWGLVQVQATIQNGQISNVQFLQYPSDRRTSQRINSIANPELEQEAIQAQSANVDIISGATLTSEGFQQSLQDALSQAKG